MVTLDEAVRLREAGIRQPILLLQGPQRPDDCKTLAAHGLWPVLHDEAQIAWYACRSEADSLRAWLKVDTGMGRLGVLPERAHALLQSEGPIRWLGVLSHLARADDPGNTHTGRAAAHLRLAARHHPGAQHREFSGDSGMAIGTR